MKFIDSAKIYLKPGDGGKGCLSYYYRGKKRFPSGGNGGVGGGVYLQGNSSLNSLTYLKYHPHQKAGNGLHGKGKNQNGRSGKDKIIEVPLGTLLLDEQTQEEICETLTPEKILILKGSEGGVGNQNFKTGKVINEEILQGKLGIEKTFILELKIIADVGLVGLPNAGKSTFLSKISNQSPKIADYPFTTLFPQLGVVNLADYQSFVVADIPGLIEGAHDGKGLGHRFLKHIQRTKFLFFLIDGSNKELSIKQSFLMLKKELALFSKTLLEKNFVVLLNKQDKIKNLSVLEKEKEYFQKNNIKVYWISALSGDGIENFLNEVKKCLI